VNRLWLKGYDCNWRGQEVAKKFEVAKGEIGWGLVYHLPFSLFFPLSSCFLFTPSSAREPVHRLPSSL